MHVCLVAQSCPTLCDPLDYSLPGFSVHGIFQARILKWIAISSSRGSSWPRDRICVSCIASRLLTHWAIMDTEYIIAITSDLQTEKAVAPHSSTLAWKIPWMQEPGRLQSMGSLRVGQDWVTSLSLFTFMHWRRKWQPTPVFLPGESQGRGSLVGCCLWGRTELDTTEAT